MAKCSIGLGGNLDNTASCFDDALSRLSDGGVQIVRVSTTIITRAMGVSAGGDFLNAVAVLDTTLTPNELLALLHTTERQLGRQRTVHWGPRTVDLDLLLYAEESIDSNALVLPHPALWYRRFVLQPHAEVAGEWIHPLLDETIQCLFERLHQQPLILDIVNQDETQFSLQHMESQLSKEFSRERFRLRSTTADGPHDEDGFARIEVVPHNVADRVRTQPRNHTDRTVTITTDPSLAVEGQIRTAVRDFLTAALGETGEGKR
ncbi:MAG: 2-amino-4-hydroxy-6-hydroxymethyldihydropteridine diphosphokinase [Fuerstiella sp.]